MTEESDRHAAERRALEEARRTRGLLLELAVRADYFLGEALSWYVGFDDDRRKLLISDVMWRVPADVRVRLLREAMETHGLSDIYPFIVPVLNRLFQIRNILAHSLEVPGPEGATGLYFTSINRGKATDHAFSTDALEWLRRQGDEVVSEIMLVGGALMDLDAPQRHASG